MAQRRRKKAANAKRSYYRTRRPIVIATATPSFIISMLAKPAEFTYVHMAMLSAILE